MAFAIPSFAETISDLVADFQNRFPQANVSRLSGHWKRLAVFAGGVMSLHRHIQVVSRDCMPDTARGAALDRWLAIYGLERKKPTGASKANALRITGTPAAAYTTGAQLTSADGLVYQLDESGVLPAEGYVDVDVKAISTGSATRKSIGTVLTFAAPAVGISTTATVVIGIDVNGTDTEDDGSARERLLDKIAQPNLGGAANDFRQWAETEDFVHTAYVWPLRAGNGSVHLAALKAGHGASRLLTSDEIDQLQSDIDQLRPVGYGGFRVLTVATQDQDVEVTLAEEDDPVYAFHWADNPAPAVVAYTAGTRTLQLSVRPDTLSPGDRLFWRSAVAPLHDGSEVTVEDLSGVDSVILKAPRSDEYDWTGTPPVAGNPVYAGGPLVTSVRTAIVAYMDALGPGRVDTGTPADYSYGSSYWEGTLRLAKLHNLSQKQRGVLDSRVLTPTANVAPTNLAPSDTVSVLVPRVVIVRKDWTL
jgi:uncharacterized phage protein gp47/JayE